MRNAAKLIVILLLVGFSQTGFSQINEELLKQQEDARLYLEMVDVLKNAPLDDQVAGWNRFLKKHPDNYFKEEIRGNLESMRARQALKEKAQEEEDSRLYFKTVEKATSAPLSQQIVIWDRFLRDHPDSLFANEARTTLNRLKQEKQWGGGEVPVPSKQPTPVVQKTPPTPKPEPAVQNLEPKKPEPAKPDTSEGIELATQDEDEKYLDPERALFLAVGPGLIVPGLGHFYAKQYAIGAFLASLRVVGLLVLAAGIFEDSIGFTIPGGVITGTSYFLDVLRAPEAAREYNAKLNPLPPLDDNAIPESNLGPFAPTRTASFQFSFSF